MPTRLLIVEDDPALREILVRTLAAEGFQVTATARASELLARAEDQPPDAVVIDIGLPDGDGRDLCQALRSRGIRSPVLFLTARDALTDRLSGFAAGGDDYVIKPFDIEEVLARLHALLRRSGPATPAVHRGLTLDPAQLSVAAGGQSQTLTPTEFRVLGALAAHDDRILGRRELIRAAWPYGAIVQENTLDVYIARLRRKLSQLPGSPEIKTVHRFGYQLR